MTFAWRSSLRRPTVKQSEREVRWASKVGSTPGTTQLMIAVSACFFLECQFKNNNGVYGLFFPFIQNENAFLDPMRKMYILRISDYLLQLIAECQCEK